MDAIHPPPARTQSSLAVFCCAHHSLSTVPALPDVPGLPDLPDSESVVVVYRKDQSSDGSSGLSSGTWSSSPSWKLPSAGPGGGR